MDNESPIGLANDRLTQSLECINSAEADIELGHLKSAANRSYYSVYHSMRAVLALAGFESKKHFGNSSEFRRLYIKTGIFEAKHSDIITNSYNLRQKCDYLDYYIAMEAEVIEQLFDAKHFYNEVKLHIKNTA